MDNSPKRLGRPRKTLLGKAKVIEPRSPLIYLWGISLPFLPAVIACIAYWDAQDIEFTEYTHDVKYLMKTEGFSILETNFNFSNNTVNVSVILEDKDGNVKREYVCSLLAQPNTKVTEKTVDLAKGVCFVPFRLEEKETVK